MITHRTLDGSWATCEEKDCQSPIHVEMSITEAQQLPESFIEMLAEVVDPPDSTAFYSRWWQDEAGETHRGYDLPAIIDKKGNRWWYRHGEFHRDGDKPAGIDAEGGRYWAQHGRPHRDNNLPAAIGSDGYQRWYVRGKLHRTDGPAVINPDGSQEWWEHDNFLRGLHVDGTTMDTPRPVSALML